MDVSTESFLVGCARAPNPDGTLKIRLYFDGVHKIEYVGLYDGGSRDNKNNNLHCVCQSLNKRLRNLQAALERSSVR